MEKLGPKWASRVSSKREIGVEVVAARVGGDEQLGMYRLMMENVWAMVQEGFSDKVIEVGKTTAEELEWWFRDVMRWRVGYFPPRRRGVDNGCFLDRNRDMVPSNCGYLATFLGDAGRGGSIHARGR